MKTELKILLQVFVLDCVMGGAFYWLIENRNSLESLHGSLAGLGLLVLINLIIIPNVLFADQIIGSLVGMDYKDYQKGKYWTPFGMRDVKPGTSLKDMANNSKDAVNKMLGL